MSYYTPEPVTPTPLSSGDRIKFSDDRRVFLVRAVSPNFAVCTRQADFRPRGHLAYTVVDWRNGVRGPVNVLGQGWDVTTDEQCEELCALLEAGRWQVSQRNWRRINLTEPVGAAVGA
ncbi:hypothetical protein ABIC28_005155 [Rhodococcus sp. PvR044]|uniref:hypothetical protein n=1 Tax=Rhodococcus sp. PvR044 TaxID=3156402 RepID=UPI0033945F90